MISALSAAAVLAYWSWAGLGPGGRAIFHAPRTRDAFISGWTVRINVHLTVACMVHGMPVIDHQRVSCPTSHPVLRVTHVLWWVMHSQTPTALPPCPAVHGLEHPLDQLTPAEISRASAAVRAHAAAQGIKGLLRFNTIQLAEPPKAALLAYEAGAGPRPERTARVWVLHPASEGFWEAVVGLEAPGNAGGAVHSWTKVRS